MRKSKLSILLGIIIILVLFNYVFAATPTATISPVEQNCTINKECIIQISGTDQGSTISPTSMKLDWKDGYKYGYGELTSYLQSHTYSSISDYSPALTVKNSKNEEDTDLAIIHVVNNLPPIAHAGEDMFALEDQTLEFSSLGTYDPDGEIDSYSWDFGDGKSSNLLNPTHKYTNKGKYTVTLTVTDDGNPTLISSEKSTSDSIEVDIKDVNSGLVMLPAGSVTVNNPVIVFNMPIVFDYPTSNQVGYSCRVKDWTASTSLCYNAGAFEPTPLPPYDWVIGHCDGYGDETFPRFTYYPTTEGTGYSITVDNGNAQSFNVGNMTIFGTSWETIKNFGPISFKTGKMLVEEKVVDFEASYMLISPPPTKTVTYHLYRLDGCLLVPIESGSMNVNGAIIDAEIDKPECNQAECMYFGSIEIDVTGAMTDYGGGVFTFTYENTLTGSVDIDLEPPFSVGSDAQVLANVAGLGDFIGVQYTLDTPSGTEQGNMKKISNDQYGATISLEEKGLYTIHVTATALNQTWNSANISESFNVGSFDIASLVLTDGAGGTSFSPGGALEIQLRNSQFNNSKALGLKVKGILHDSEKKSIETFDHSDFTEKTCGTGCYEYSTKTTLPVTLPLGNYTVLMEAGIGNDTEQIQKSFVVGGSGTLQASPSSINFGFVGAGDVINKTITITNIGSAPVMNVSAALSQEIGPLLEVQMDEKTLYPLESVAVTVSPRIIGGMLPGEYEGTLTISSPSLNETAVVPITFTIKPEINTSVTPSEVYITEPAGAEVTREIEASYYSATGVGNITLDVKKSGAITGATVSYDEDMQSNTATLVTLTLTAPDEPFNGSLEFEFNYQGALVGTESVGVSGVPGTGNDTTGAGQGLSLSERIEQLRDEIIRLRGRLANIRAQAGTKHAKKIAANATTAENFLDSAEQSLFDAEGAIDAGSKDDAELFIADAEDDISAAARIISRLEQFVAMLGQSTGNSGLLIALIIFIILGAFGGVIFALREGWIPAEKVPWLVAIFEKLGLGWLIQSASVPTPQPRFAGNVVARPAPVAPVRRRVQHRPAAQSMAAQWQEYYRRHPEYAKRMHQHYTNYYLRKYH